MNRRDTLRLLTVLLLSALNVSANGFRLGDVDAFATARGEAFVATADNASAIYYNPAGITQLDGKNYRAGIYAIDYDLSYSPNSTTTNKPTYNNKKNSAAIPQLFYTSDVKDLPLSVGLGIYTPYGGNSDWPQQAGFRSIAINSSLEYLTISPVVAVKVTPTLSLGAGAMISYANLNSQQGVNGNTNVLFKNMFNFSGDGWGIGYTVGLLWQPQQKISIGACLRSSTRIKLTGTTEWEYPKLRPNPTYQTAYANYTFPYTAVFGVSYRPTPKWNLEVDADYTDWSSIDEITINQAATVPGVWNTNKVHETLNWQPSWMYEFGATRYLGKCLQVSAGYVIAKSAVPDAHYTPNVADMDRQFVSVGAGYKGKAISVDAAYQYGYAPQRKVSGSIPPISGWIAGQTADGTYKFNSQAVIVTVGLRF